MIKGSGSGRPKNGGAGSGGSGSGTLLSGLKRVEKVEICGGQKSWVGIRMRIRKYQVRIRLIGYLGSLHTFSNTRLTHHYAVYFVQI
jgi:hypothetical protein